MHMELKKIFSMTIVLLTVFSIYAKAETIQSYYDLGVFAYEAGDYEKAQRFLIKAADQNPQDAYVKFYLGKTMLQLNMLSEADIFLKKARALNPDIPGLSYEQGILSYKLGNYKDGLGFFEKAAAENPTDALALYYAGICSFMIEDYQKAIDYLTRSTDISPSVKNNAYYYAGISHYKLKAYGPASEKLDYVAAHADTTSLRQDADMWLQIIQSEKAQAKPYSLYVKAGLQYDDNVTLADVDSDLVSDESDVSAVGYLTGRYAIVKRQHLDFGFGYSHFQTKYQDLSEYDLIGAMPEIYSEYSLNPVTLGISYIPNYYWVDGESYLMQHQASPEIRWLIDDNNEITLTYSYYRNNYFTEGERDGHANEVSVDFYHGLQDARGYLLCRGAYEDNTASAKDEYFTEASGTLGFSYNILNKTNLLIYGTYFDKQYDHTDSAYKVKRDDSRYFASVSIMQPVLYEWLSISLEYNYTNNDSNISDYDYERNTIALYGVANF
jgi:tetratricopeptide (TPR) repeat protein